MIKGIDHVVILVADLDRAVADYAELGFTVTPGGEHTGGATHNALVAFADGSYFELIAFKQPAPGHRWFDQLAAGEGIIDFALLPGAIEQDLAAARARGVAIDGPSPLGRVRPDGQRVDWFLGTPQTTDLPFLCADVTPRALRVPEGDTRIHPNGVTGIAAITVAISDLQASVARYYGLLAETTGTVRSPQIDIVAGLGVQIARFTLQGVQIVLASPLGEAVVGSAGAALRAHLATRGEGPYAVALRTTRDRPPVSLDPALAHGARLDLITA